MRFFLLALVLAACAGYRPVHVEAPDLSREAPPTLITEVDVFTGFDEFLLHDMDVLLVGGRVRGMVPTGQHELEGRVQMISGKGKVLLPGLVEIGRASCRERAWIAVRGAALTQEDEAMTAGR